MTTIVDMRARRAIVSRAAVGGAVVVGLAAAGGWWAGGVSRSPEPVAAPSAVVAVGPLSVQLAGGWEPAAPAPGPDVPGAVAFAPTAGIPARVLLATAPVNHPSLLPAALRAELEEPLPRPRRVLLAGRRALVYGPVTRGRTVLSVTVLPTTEGVLAVACSAPPGIWDAAAGCAAGVEAVAPGDGRILAPEADLAFRTGSGGVLRRLDARRVAGRTALARTRRPAGRRRVARRLAGAHREAAAALAPLAAPGASAAAVAALRSGASSYAQLARAARRPRPYAAASSRVVRADAALARALSRLRR